MSSFLTVSDEVALELHLRHTSSLSQLSSNSSDVLSLTQTQHFTRLWSTRICGPQDEWDSITPRDAMHHALHAELRRLRSTCYRCFRLCLYIWPASDAPVVFNDRNSEMKFFTFSETEFDVAHTAPVMLVQGNERSSTPALGEDHGRNILHILIRFDGLWRSFEEFLHYIYSSSSNISADDWNGQWMWWTNNRKKFKILALPAEIREKIYEFLLMPTHAPQDRDWYPWTWKSYGLHPWTARPRASRHHRQRMRTQYMRSTSILRVSRQVGFEAAAVLYRHTRFEFTSASHLEHFLTAVHGKVDRVRHVILKFTWSQLFKFFGNEDPDEDASWAADVLARLNLLSLVIWLPSICHDEDRRLIWDVMQRALPTLLPQWVPKFMVPFVKDLPIAVTGEFEEELNRLLLEGIAKEKSSSNDFIVVDNEDEQDDEDGGVRLDEKYDVL